ISRSSSSDRELLAERLRQTQEYNDYVTITYFDQELNGIVSSRNQNIMLSADLSLLSEEGRNGIRKALKGESSVSRLFESQISDGRVFAYSVPVYDGEEIIGALSASDHIEIFSDILSGNTVLGGGGYIHLI